MFIYLTRSDHINILSLQTDNGQYHTIIYVPLQSWNKSNIFGKTTFKAQFIIQPDNMQIIAKLTLVFLLGLSVCFADDNAVLREQCGGTITSDSSSLIFPGNSESIRPGETCVWTILLETTRDFRMNFRHFDSNSTDCEEGGVRIYSLSNLVSSDNIVSYE